VSARQSSGPASSRSFAYKIVDMMIGLRVTEEEEREGLDISSHGESAYRI
jgi:ammonia channel protein AmtB